MEHSDNGYPYKTPSPLESPQLGAWLRRTVFALFTLHIAFLLFWSGAGRAPISNILQLLIGLGATAVCFYNARLAAGLSRFWRITGAAFLLWNAALAVSIVYEDVLYASTTSWWPSDLLFFIAPAPLLLTAFDDTTEHRRISFIDVLQLVTVSVAVYLCFIFVPWKALGDSVEFGLREWKVLLIRDAIMFLLFLGRLWRDREWSSSGAVAAYLLVYGAGEGVYLYYQAQNILHSGTLADLVWSAPFIVALLISRRPQRQSAAPVSRPSGALFYGAMALHVLLLVAVLFSVTTFTGAQLRIAQTGLVLSFFLFAVRMVRVHRVLAGTIREVQVLNQGLETRVQERTRQLQAANRDLQRQNAEISRLAKLKSRFMANVSHEFRTPLNAMIGFSSLLLGENGHDAAKHRQYLEHVHKSAVDLSRLVNDVFDFTGLEAGDFQLALGPVNLQDLCREIVTGLGPVLQEKQLRAECQVATVQVAADKARLRQVLLNLMNTAIQFTPPHGTIRLTVMELPGVAEIRICDDGQGIPLEGMEEIFSEFSQLGPDRERQIAGPGLRLVLARKLIEMHGGTIHVENDHGHGTSFVFTIPLVPS
ncbi:MAG: HAMP domain-containing histidine kinase [Acidobacteriia bacterium]|nr:HAMP domain-containing histidine kinase [Terriglobia bacterium]